MTVFPESMGWALWQRQEKGRMPLGFWYQLRKGAETQNTPMEQQLLKMYTELLEVKPLNKG